MNINFGCGGNILAGWKNHDADVDITKPVPYPDNCAEMILAEHVFEHISGPEALRFLDECHRILKPGGRLRLCVPVISERLTREHARDLTLGHGHLACYTPELLRTFLWMAGFTAMNRTARKECDGHHKVIGAEKDDLETCRWEAIK